MSNEYVVVIYSGTITMNNKVCVTFINFFYIFLISVKTTLKDFISSWVV